MKLKYNDGLGSGDVKPHLAFVYNGKIFPFEEKSISPFMIIVSSIYEKNGKWSNTTYFMEINDNLGVFEYRRDMHNGDFASIGTWEELLAFFTEETSKLVELDELKTYIKNEFPKVYSRLEENDQLLSELNKR